MLRLRNLSLNHKLTFMTMAICGTVLLLALTAFIARDLTVEPRTLVRRTSMLAEIIAANSAAPLAFGDDQAATENLSVLRADPHVIASRIYSKDGAIFAHYRRKGPAGSQIPFTAADQGNDWLGYQRLIRERQNTAARSAKPLHFWRKDHLDVFMPIFLDGEFLGTVYIRTDLEEIRSRILWYLGNGAAIMLVLSLVAYLLSLALRRIVGVPVTHLAEVMRKVSDGQNYAIRAQAEGNDEIGFLVKGFNRMLQRIEESDARLKRHREELEEEVLRRTDELSHANSELGRAVDELTLARDEADAANRAKSRFLSNMSHEIRTPLNGVIGMTSLLLDTGLTGKERDYVEMALSSGESLLAIVTNILDFSKIEGGTLQIDTVDFDPHRIVEELATLYGSRTAGKGVTFACRMDDGVPHLVRGDSQRLRQIVDNLLDNAVKFTPCGEISLIVRGTVQGTHCLLTCIVSDTGVGIAAEALPALFQPFTQADDSSTRTYGGTGLGLALVRQLVDLMGGTVAADSEPGRGSVFRVSLPFALSSSAIDGGGSPEADSSV